MSQHKAVNGFIAYLLTWASFLIFIVWSGVAEETLHSVQFTYYPDKYWAVAVPAFFTMLAYYYISTYLLMYLRNTKPLTDMFYLTDNQAKGAKPTLGTLAEVEASVPPITDIPVVVTSKVFFEAWE